MLRVRGPCVRPPAEAAQADYETLRAHLLGHASCPMTWPRHGSPGAGWPG
jgi:hypothetical protein